jgi:hypothetical protein
MSFARQLFQSGNVVRTSRSSGLARSIGAAGTEKSAGVAVASTAVELINPNIYTPPFRYYARMGRPRNKIYAM